MVRLDDVLVRTYLSKNDGGEFRLVNIGNVQENTNGFRQVREIHLHTPFEMENTGTFTIVIAYLTTFGKLEASETFPEAINANPTHLQWSVSASSE
jgi:hypothetical protein